MEITEPEKILTFKLSDDNRKLYAILNPAKILENPPEKISKNFILTELSKSGFEDFYIYEDIIGQLVDYYRIKKEVIISVIAERRDCDINVEVSSDKMIAWLKVEKAYGGQPVTRELIEQKLKESGVIFGINQSLINRAVTDGYMLKTIIAEGKAPIKGNNAYFEPLIEKLKDKGKAKIKEDGSVDYHDLNIVNSVEVGQPLMRKHPATEGIPGRNVFGETIKALPGEDKDFGKFKGSVISSDDPNLLIATIAGQPTIGKNWVHVHPVFSIAEVGYSSGDIDFPGVVIVSGIVNTGFKIKAGQDVIVFGIVEGATIEAGGNIDLKSGVVGGGKAIIKANGNIKARFIENAYLVESNGSISVEDQIIHSDVIASEKIEVGKEFGKGQITGGTVRATSLIYSRILGSQVGTTTFVEVGLNPYIENKFNSLEQELETNKRELEEIIKNIVYLRTHHTQDRVEQLQKLEGKRDILMDKIEKLSESKNILSQQMRHVENSKIIVREKIYSGIKIRISKTLKEINKDMPGGTFRLRGRSEIIFSRN